LAIAGLLLASGCGYIGPPKAPALHIPTPVGDLRAMEFGDKVLVQFTVPMLTTDGIVQTSLRGAELYAGPAPQNFNRDQWASTATHVQIAVTAPGPVEKEFPVEPAWIGHEIVLAVRVIGDSGRFSDWSGNAILGVDPPLVAPRAFQAAASPAGVALRWTGSGPRYRVLRSTPDAPAEVDRALVPAGESDTAEFVDANAVYGTHYQYVVIAISGEQHQSLPSEPALITPADIFPPAVPANVTALPRPQSVDLAWTRNEEEDLQGYNVRRSVDMGPFELIAPLVPTPAYADRGLESGKQYRYTVTAVDTAGNESAQSAPVTVVIP